MLYPVELRAQYWENIGFYAFHLVDTFGLCKHGANIIVRYTSELFLVIKQRGSERTV